MTEEKTTYLYLVMKLANPLQEWEMDNIVGPGFNFRKMPLLYTDTQNRETYKSDEARRVYSGTFEDGSLSEDASIVTAAIENLRKEGIPAKAVSVVRNSGDPVPGSFPEEVLKAARQAGWLTEGSLLAFDPKTPPPPRQR